MVAPSTPRKCAGTDVIFPGTGNRIVNVRPGPQTGDSYFYTEDGRVWVATTDMTPRTGVSFGYVDGDRIVPPGAALPVHHRTPKPEKPHDRHLDLRDERKKWRRRQP